MFNALLPHLFSLGRKITKAWDGIPADKQVEYDQLFRETVKILPLPDDFAKVKAQLVDGEGTLPERVIMVAMDPSVRGLITGARDMGTAERIEPDVAVVKCRNCGFLQDLEVPD